MDSKERVNFYIDGFNLYNGLMDRGLGKKNSENHRWLNLTSLCSKIIEPHQTLNKVSYFSAFAYWKPGAKERHEHYVAALKATGVRFVEGKFKEKELQCKKCYQIYVAHEEKQTDVNIILSAYEDAINDEFDLCYIVSADSDMVPIIQKLQTLGKRVGFFPPINRYSSDIESTADLKVKMKRNFIENSLFDREFTINGETFISPIGWSPSLRKRNRR